MNKQIKHFELNIEKASFKSCSIFDNIEFSTLLCKNIPINKINKYSNMLDRQSALDNLMKYVDKHLDISISIEAGIFEFALLYLITKKYDDDVFISIYQDKLNEIINNLNKNSTIQNFYLKDNVINNNIDPKTIAFLKPHELFPKRWDKELKKKQLIEYKKNNMDSTDSFQCRKCKARRSKVTQQQTRSADEPITTFVTCLNCQHVLVF